MFRAIISPIFKSTRLCVTARGIMQRYNAGRYPRSGGIPLPAYRPATSLLHFTTSWKHSLAHLKMGKIIARNMLSWLELLLNRYFFIYLVVYIIYINDTGSNKHQTYWDILTVVQGLFFLVVKLVHILLI